MGVQGGAMNDAIEVLIVCGMCDRQRRARLECVPAVCGGLCECGWRWAVQRTGGPLFGLGCRAFVLSEGDSDTMT
jgi:hypothetical protein